jgi:hypothetical protein
VIVATVGVAVNVVLFVVFALQLVALRRQVQQSKDATNLDHARRRAQATIEFYQSTLEKRKALRAVLPYDGDAAAVAELIERALHESGERESVTEYLGLFELLAMGTNTGVFDIAVLERMAGTRVRALTQNYMPWISARRAQLEHPKLYSELVALSLHLEARRARAQELGRAYLDDVSLDP